MFIERIRHTISHIYSREDLERAENKRRNVHAKDAISGEEEQARKEERNFQDNGGASPKRDEHSAAPQHGSLERAEQRPTVLDIRV